MKRKITNRGAFQAAIDIVLLAIYFVGGVAGIMYASVLLDLTFWFYAGAGVFLLFTALELVGKVTKPLDNYETRSVES
jgi:hypothetical protein